MSWIRTIPYDEATGELRKIYDETKAKFGDVINLVSIQSLRPDTMALGRQMYRHLMTSPSGLNRLQRILIATVVSRLNNCHYWVESHEQDLREEIQDEEKVLKIQEDFTQVEFDCKTKALLEFAKKTTLTPRELNKSDVEVLQEVGFDDKDILDAAQLIGYFNYSNRLMDCLGIEPEPEMRYKKQGSENQAVA